MHEPYNRGPDFGKPAGRFGYYAKRTRRLSGYLGHETSSARPLEELHTNLFRREVLLDRSIRSVLYSLLRREIAGCLERAVFRLSEADNATGQRLKRMAKGVSTIGYVMCIELLLGTEGPNMHSHRSTSVENVP